MISKFVFIAAFVLTPLVLAAAPSAAQIRTQNDQAQSAIQGSAIGNATGGATGSTTAPTQAPITGVFCIEEMTANFCNVVTGPNIGGYGARSGSASTSGSASANGFAATHGAGVGIASIPPCPAEPPFNELCN